MSRFLDRLDRINRGAPTTLGFGAARAEKVPSMALLGMLSDPARAAQGASVLAEIGADGALIEGMGIDDINKKLAKKLDKVPWGIKVSELKGDQVTSYRGKGCDFLAFSPEGASLGALEDEDTAYLLCIQLDMEERLLRAIEDLPVDAVLLPMTSVVPPLTLQHMMSVSSVRSSFSKYLLLEMPGLPTSEELGGLREIGVDGLVVDATSVSASELKGLKERLLTLPKRQRFKSVKADAILPSSVYSFPSTPSREDEEDD